MKKKKILKSTPAVTADNYVQTWRSMLDSPAYRALSHMARRVLACLELEHLRHGGKDNGHLVCTYATLMEYCLTKDRSAIARALFELRELGFNEIKPGKACRSGDHTPNEYRLTHVPVDNDHPATNEWAYIRSIAEAKEIVKRFSRKQGQSDWLKTASEADKLRSGLSPETSKECSHGYTCESEISNPSESLRTDPSDSEISNPNPAFRVCQVIPSASLHVVDTYLECYPSRSPDEATTVGATTDQTRPISAAATQLTKPANGKGPEDDTKWFQDNPRRNYHLREPFPGEVSKSDSANLWIVIQQLGAGAKMRRIQATWPVGIIPKDREEVARSMFERVATE